MFLMMMTKRNWPTWLAFRSIATAVICIIAAVILHKTAMPALIDKGELNKSNVPIMTRFVIDNHQWLPFVPVPALLVGIAAIILRPMRKMLAPVAALACLIAFVVVVGSLVLVMMPMYSTMNLLNR